MRSVVNALKNFENTDVALLQSVGSGFSSKYLYIKQQSM